MAMTSRERMLTALDNGRGDRLPCQVHGWMGYYLAHTLDGADWYQQGDVQIWPKDAKSVKPFPSVLT